nr:transposase (putative), gypsy type [Tanacetum cinerariifolium]
MGRSCTKSSEEMNSCTIRGKPLVLPWGRISRLDSDAKFSPLLEIFELFNLIICASSLFEELLQRAFDVFCEKFHIPEEIHPVLPNRGDTMHERPAEKIGLYTSGRFNAQDYATLVAHRSPFWKFPEEFLCLVGLSRHYTLDEETYPLFLDKDGEDMDILVFIYTLDPTKVKVVEQERKDDEPWLLKTTVGRIVPLLPVAPGRGESELDASVDKLFDKGGSGIQTEQEDFAGGVKRKRKTIVADAGGLSHPSKKLREDHETPSGAFVGGKSSVRVKVTSTFPFVTSFVSATPKREGEEAEVDSFARPSVPVITAATAITSTADPVMVVKEKIAKPSLFFVDSTSAGGIDPAIGGFTDFTGSDFLVSGIRTVINPESDLQKIYVPQMEHEQFFTEFNVGAGRQMSLSTEVRMRVGYNIREKRRLESIVEKNQLLKARDEEIENLKAHMMLKEAEVAEAIRLRVEASNFKVVEKSLRDEVNALNGRNTILEKEHNAQDVKVTDLEAAVVSKERELTDSNAQLTSTSQMRTSLIWCMSYRFLLPGLKKSFSNYENLTKRLEEFQDAHLKVVNDKFDNLYTDFIEMTLHLEERYARWVSGRKEGRVLTDVAAYNPSAEMDYVSALQQLQDVNFPLLAELKSNKDATDGPTHHSPDKTVVGASALSLSLDVSDARVRRIRENITSHRSFLHGVFVPLAEPFSAAALTGTKGTSDTAPGTTTAPSTTFVSASSIPPISTDDYEVVRLDGQEGAGAADGNADPFANVDDVDLNVLR